MYLNLFANSKLATQFMLALVVFEVKTHSPTQWKVSAKQVLAWMLIGKVCVGWETSDSTPPLTSCALIHLSSWGRRSDIEEA